MATLLTVAAAAAAVVLGGLPTAMADDSSAPTSPGSLSGNSLQYPVYFNWSLTDSSAMFDYSSAEGDKKGVWNVTFSESSWSTYQQGDAGRGVSAHTANSTRKPTLYFNLPMTAFYVYGKATNKEDDEPAQMSLVIDRRTPTNVTPSDGLICHVEDLLWGFHTVQLTLETGEWEFTGIRMVSGASILPSSLANVTTQVEPFGHENGTLNNFYNFSGDWAASPSLGPDGGNSTPVNYSHVTASGGSTTSLIVPPGTAWVALYGAVRPDSTEYVLQWDPLPPLTDADMRFTSYNPWMAQSTFYLAPLLPEVNYTLTIVGDTINPLSLLSLHSMVFYNKALLNSTETPDYEGTSSSVNKGAIAGGVVGGVAGLLLIGLLVWLLVRRRKRTTPANGSKGSNSTDETHSEQFEMDDVPEATQPHLQPFDYKLGQPDGEIPAIGEGQGRPQHLAISTSSTHLPGGIALSPLPDSSVSTPASHAGRSAQPRLLPVNPDDNPSEPGSSQPIHPMAAELKHGPSRRAPRPPPRTRQVEQETDGGAIVSDDIELVPPVYNPAWARDRQLHEPLSGITTAVGSYNGSPSHSPTAPMPGSSNAYSASSEVLVEGQYSPQTQSPSTDQTHSERDHLYPTPHPQ